jgi:NTE family protein
LTSGELGVALSGGGARALAQLGVLKVLERERVPVTHIAGTSAGGIVGALYVTSRDAREAEERVLEHLQTTGVGFNAETFASIADPEAPRVAGLLEIGRGLWRATRQGRGIIGGDAMRDSLRRLLGGTTFADARLPFATAALDLASGRRVIFAGGALVDAVYASSAIPGLFEPLELGDYLLVDGGWAEPVPVNTCHHLGAIHVIAVDVPTRHTPPAHHGAMATALQADAMARELLEEMQLREADFVVRPRVAVKHFADFSDPEGLIAAGERAAEQVLPEIAAVLERHRSLFVRAPTAA